MRLLATHKPACAEVRTVDFSIAPLKKASYIF